MLNLVFLRIWRERRLMGVLLFSMCLVAGFLALGPLYVRAIAAADFDQRVTNAENNVFQVDIRNNAPMDTSMRNTIETTVGDYTWAIRNYHARGNFNCGNTTRDSELVTTIRSCYRTMAYNQLDDLFTIVEGKMPDGAYQNDDSDVVIEALTTTPNIEKSNTQLGDIIVFTNQSEESIRVQIVGIAEPALSPQNPFWEGQTMLNIFRTPLPNNDFRPDLTLAMRPSVYDQYLIEIIGGNPEYIYRVDIDRTTLSSRVVDDLEHSLDALQSSITQQYPDVVIRTWLTSLVDNYRRGVAEAQFPVTLLSFLVLVLMLYNIYTTASLILEQQGQEWAMIASRGASNRQLIWIQFLTVLIMGIIAFAVAPIMAYTIMLILSFVGPQAPILELVHISSFSSTSILLSGIAVIITVICLTLPAWSAANQSLSRLKQGLSRPPVLPAWSRFYLDVILLAIGFGLLLRLYVLSTGNSPMQLLQNPTAILTLFATQDVGAFTDIFNLAVPALLLTGGTLLWMRIFPYLMKLSGSLFANGDGLTTRLAFWNVERDPAHYAQLVLLLIGTLALGVASLTLSSTRELGAWQAARQATGGDLLVNLDPQNRNRETDWQALPNVIDALPMLIVPTGNRRDGALVGVDLSQLSPDTHPSINTALQPLIAQPPLDLGGLQLPTNTELIQLDVYPIAPSTNNDAPVETRINLEVQDKYGVNYIIPLETEDETITGEFVTYEAQIANIGIPPYTLIALQWDTRQGTQRETQQTAYLDNLVAISQEGVSSVIESFEPETASRWRWAQGSRFRQVLESTAFSPDESRVTEGDFSLKVLYTTLQTDANISITSMMYRPVTQPPIPAIVSSEFALSAGQRSRFNRSLQVGDTMSTAILIPFDRTATGDIEISYTIMGIYDDLLGYSDASYIIADVQELRHWLNNIELFRGNYGTSDIYDINTIRLALDTREPTPELIAAIDAQSDVVDDQSAWTRFTEIQRDPLANAVTGILFAGFWISLLLGLMDFAFYMAITIRRRALSFATLQAIGWSDRNLLSLLAVEQAAFITPALVIGVIFGLILAYLILPFLALLGNASLQVPWLAVIGLILVLTASFSLILRLTARVIRRMSVITTMRFGE